MTIQQYRIRRARQRATTSGTKVLAIVTLFSFSYSSDNDFFLHEYCEEKSETFIEFQINFVVTGNIQIIH